MSSRRNLSKQRRSPSPRARSASPARPAALNPGGICKKIPVFLWVPCLIGYARIAAYSKAFGVAFTNRKLFVTLYVVSFMCADITNQIARAVNQAGSTTASTYGAVLHTVVDRLFPCLPVGSAGLLMTLSHLYRLDYKVFLGLFALDIASHWFKMYSMLLARRMGKKVMTDTKNPLLHFYNNCHYFRNYCNSSAEVVYIICYLLAWKLPRVRNKEPNSEDIMHAL